MSKPPNAPETGDTTTAVPSPGSADPAMTAALEWFVRLQDQGLPATDRRAFETWLATDPAHAVAFERARALWDRFEPIAAERSAEREGSERLDRRKLLLGGAVIGLAGTGALVAQRIGLFADYRTGISERRVLRLPDGGWLELGSDSSLSQMGGSASGELLLDQGEGFFASAPAHALVVTAGAVTTQAVAAEFNVKRLESDVTVSVAKGMASVAAGPFAPIAVEAGWQAWCRPRHAPVLVKADLARVTAWRHDRIVFHDTPLPQVAAELERYRHGRIVLVGRHLSDLTVTAAFDARRSDAALDTLGATLPIRITRLTPLLTLVRAL